MKEQQNAAGTAPGRRKFGLSSGIDRRDRTDAELPQRIVTRRDETVRAGKHYYRPQGFTTGLKASDEGATSAGRTRARWSSLLAWLAAPRSRCSSQSLRSEIIVSKTASLGTVATMSTVTPRSGAGGRLRRSAPIGARARMVRPTTGPRP